MEELEEAPIACYTFCPPQDQTIYEHCIFRDVTPYCEDCFALATTITPDMFLLSNLHCLLCSFCHHDEGSHTSTWSSIFKRGDRHHHDIYTNHIRPFLTSLPGIHVVLITNPSKLHSWDEGIAQRSSNRPFWFTETVGTFCRSAGGKSARACILRGDTLMPLLSTNLPFWRLTTHESYVRYKITFHLIEEILVEFLLGPGPCFRPLPAIAALRKKGYIPGTSKLRSASFAIWNSEK